MKHKLLLGLLLAGFAFLHAQSPEFRERKAKQLAEPSPFQADIDGAHPERIYYQDSLVVVFNSIAPQAPVHLLIVPRKRIPTINDLTDADSAILDRMFWAARKVAKEKGIDESGYRLAFNTNEDAGQSAFHLHLHLLGGMKTGPMIDQRWRNRGPQPGGSYQRALSNVKAVYEAYFAAWLRADSTALLAQMTPDAVIMPDGLPPAAGSAAIRAFWFPADGSRTTVTKFDHTLDEIRLDGNMAYIRGTSRLSFVYEKDGKSIVKNDVPHTRLMIFERQDDDSWLITCNMWGAL